MAKLFGRVTRLRIIPKTGDIVTIHGKSIEREGFDLSFDIEKNLQTTPNKAKFTIYNLPDDVRAKLQLKDDDAIEFEAGYKTTSAVVFRGNVTHAIHYLDGADWVSVIEAGEGHKAYRKSYVAKSYGAGTPFKTVVEDIVKTFEGFKVTPAITKAISAVGKTFPDGLTIDGKSADVLNQVLKQGGLEFSIQGNEIQMVKEDTQASDAPAINLDYTSGLVGVPQIGEKEGKPTVTFDSLIQPGLVPGRKVFVGVDGVRYLELKCKTVKIVGDNGFGNDFYCKVEAELPS